MALRNPFDDQFDGLLDRMEELEMGLPRMLGTQALAVISASNTADNAANFMGRIVSLCVELERTRTHLGRAHYALQCERMNRHLAQDRLIAILSDLGPVDLDALLEEPG